MVLCELDSVRFVGRFSLQARPIIGLWNNKSTPNFIFFSTGGKSASLPLSGGYGALVGGRDLRAFFLGVLDVQNVRSKFFEKNAFFVLTSEKYGVIYPAGKNNKKKYNHYVCYIRTDDSDTN